jgi:glutamate dehydrogenase
MAFDNFKILHALGSYVKQLGISTISVEEFIKNNPKSCKSIVEAFESKFNPSSPKEMVINLEKTNNELQNKFALILKELVSKSIVRTNYFLNKPYISFKVRLSNFDEKIAVLPKPLTFREIFVFAEEFEAIHLRNGKIARGGLRWSDRKDDFRTEVLGLVKTQNTKNSIIVPVGSKGGFVIKKQPEGLTKAESFEYGRECYRKFISGLLDITDNVINGEVATPKNVVIYDKEDPYLVVAADKGTATFSDTANEISKEYKFWMGDAFASGGSNGYDHKKMAITSRGAWVSTQRHFREMGIDVSTEEFTVVGIGDMSGDVFGNGLLRSNKIKLISAFNHLHIFIDPNPNSEVSFKERERLFNLPSSTWEDYDLTKASKGAKIFKRSDVKCELTPEIKGLFGIKEDALKPEDLIKTILKSKFDLLWNGGIGTYVKAEFEKNEQVGDKVNDVLRINGKELGAKVVAEGGNLGFTQYGRVEYELNGGRINTDAVDNSAGVDCSDHEVNIKILLNALVSSGKMTLEERNILIKSMTDEVATLVLEDNYNQTQAISLEMLNDEAKILYSKFVAYLSKEVGLDRGNEKLPSDEEVAKRGLTRPELSILMAYSKMLSYKSILKSDIIDDKFCETFLINYFPTAMRERFLPEILSHKLRNEIIATVLANRFVNLGGVFLGFKMIEAQDVSLLDVIKAYFAISSLLGTEEIFDFVKEYDYKAPTSQQYSYILQTKQNYLIPAIEKMLQTNVNGEISDLINSLKSDVEKIEKPLNNLMI